METPEIILQTENLTLKPITLDYKEEIFKEFTLEVTEHMFPAPFGKVEEAADFINSELEKKRKGEDIYFVILDKVSGEFLGGAGIHHIDRRNPEIGIWIKKSAQGNAYGKEAVAAMKKWLDENIEYDYLLYPVVDENFASKKIPEFLGGKLEREYDEINASGKKQHLLEYRISSPRPRN